MRYKLVVIHKEQVYHYLIEHGTVDKTKDRLQLSVNNTLLDVATNHRYLGKRGFRNFVYEISDNGGTASVRRIPAVLWKCRRLYSSIKSLFAGDNSSTPLAETQPVNSLGHLAVE